MPVPHGFRIQSTTTVFEVDGKGGWRERPALTAEVDSYYLDDAIVASISTAQEKEVLLFRHNEPYRYAVSKSGQEFRYNRGANNDFIMSPTDSAIGLLYLWVFYEDTKNNVRDFRFSKGRTTEVHRNGNKVQVEESEYIASVPYYHNRYLTFDAGKYVGTAVQFELSDHSVKDIRMDVGEDYTLRGFPWMPRVLTRIDNSAISYRPAEKTVSVARSVEEVAPGTKAEALFQAMTAELHEVKRGEKYDPQNKTTVRLFGDKRGSNISLPLAGRVSTTWFTVAGLVMMVAGGLLMLRRRKGS
ncbi:LPXTG cell wall anchor domain-containing protein [Candidatus Sumerlaeota bacterium]|nr:LPXTG cell wall anchor domain-containing protein [Candidatus Sumerlaeota bacterium]